MVSVESVIINGVNHILTLSTTSKIPKICFTSPAGVAGLTNKHMMGIQ